MSVTITPVAQATADALLRPGPGERAGMETGPTPLAPLFQQFADRAQLGIAGVASRLEWDGEIGVDAGGSNSTFAIRVGAIHTIVLARSDTSVRAYFAAGATLTASHLESGTTLGNSEWRYIYAYDDAGTVKYQLSTTAPRASRAFKNSVDGFLYRYLGCFRTNSSGAPIPSRTIRGVTTYLQALPVGGVSLSGPTTGYEAISLAAQVPPHARCATLDVTLTGDGQWRCIGDGGSVSGIDVRDRAVVLNASQQIEWSSAVTGGITVGVRTYSA